MKKCNSFRLAFLLTFTFIFTARPQGVALNAGDTWSYQFTNLDYVGTETAWSLLGLEQFIYNATLLSSPFGVNSLTFALYDGPPTGWLIASGGLNFGQTGSRVLDIETPAWQNLEGSFTFTVQSGSYLLNNFSFSVNLPTTTPSTYDIFGRTVTPAPEPSTFSFMTVSVVTFGLLAFKVRKL